jgi:hypothetical protein
MHWVYFYKRSKYEVVIAHNKKIKLGQHTMVKMDKPTN